MKRAQFYCWLVRVSTVIESWRMVGMNLWQFYDKLAYLKLQSLVGIYFTE